MPLTWAKHEILKPPTDAEMAQMEPEELMKLWQDYHDIIRKSKADPYRYGMVLENWKKTRDLLTKHDLVVVFGGNRCLAGEQEIYNPVAQKAARVDSITGDFHVWAWDEETKKMVAARALKPFRKPAQQLVRVSLSNGRTLFCSAEHQVLTPTGWTEVASLSSGSQIVASTLDTPQESLPLAYSPDREHSTWGTCQPEFLQDAARLSQTIADSQSGCLSCRCLCGEQPRLAEGIGQGVVPSQDDAGEHSGLYDKNHRLPADGEPHLGEGTLGDLGCKLQCSQTGSSERRPSIQDAPRQLLARDVETLSRFSCTPWLQVCESPEGQESALASLQSFHGSSPVQSFQRFPLWDNQLRRVLAYDDHKEEIASVVNIENLRVDEVWDFEVPIYRNYLASGVINHNSSKTTCGAWLVVDCLMRNPNSLIVCFAQNAELSVLVQQTALYDQLPAELRTKSLGSQEYISYTRQNGFTGNSFILPNGSRCLFKTYSQFQQNSTVLEGLELGSWEATEAPNLGAWCDEYLGGPELLNTLLYRLVTRNAKCLLTFTPIEGYTETVRLMMDGAETLEWKTADLLNNRQVPYVQKVKNRDAALIYFHTKDNPFSGYERMAKDLAACNEAEILCRAYGIATKSAATKFPKFDVGVNVLPHDKITEKLKLATTRYLIVDPAGSKNWFMAWIAVDESDTWYVYREWPDVSVGEWGAWKGNKWIPGEGAKGLGYGLRDYVNLINELETGEDIFERWMDPRLGKATYQSEDGASCLIDELSDAGLWFQPAPGLDIEQGIQAIQTKLAWNDKKPQDSINRPHFYISERCKNIIWALQEYTGEGGREEQPKDPIDCLRYAATVPIRFMDASKMKPLQRFEKYY